MAFDLIVNGTVHTVDADPQTPLLWVIRDHVGLTGTKFSCGIGQCGACTLHVDGRAIRSCSVPAAMAVGKPVVTIEGVSPDGSHPIQVAWKEFDTPQCGYCQSGMIMSALALLRQRPAPSDADIDAQVTNACRCSTYHRVRASIHGRGSDEDVRGANDRRRQPPRVSRDRRRRPGRLRAGLLDAARRRTRRRRRGAVWYEEPATPEINAWIVIAPDDTVTIRIAQTELGQGVWTSNAMMVCEELQCDWTKVRPQYASANRDAREKAPAWTLNVMGKGATDPKGGGEPAFGNRDRTGVSGIPDSLYRRMRTNAASSVKDGRYYLQLAGAEARERLLLAAAALWNVPVAELTARNSIVTHASSGRTTTYGQIAQRAAETPHPHPETITIKPPDQWTLMGTEQNNLDVPAQGDRQDGVRDRRPRTRHEMGGGEGVSRLWRRRQELRLRRDSHAARRALRRAVPDSRSRADPRPRLQRRRRRHRRHAGTRPRPRSIGCRSSGRFLPSTPRSPRRTCTSRCWPRSISRRQRAGQSGRRGRGLRASRQDRRGDVLDAVSGARAHGARQRHRARRQRSRGHLDRRSEPPGNALQRREDHRHPRAERPSAHVPPGRRLRPQRQRAPGRAGDHDREREPRHPDPYALDARGGFHRHDVSRHGRGAPEGRLSMPTAGRSRSTCARPCRKAGSAPTPRST